MRYHSFTEHAQFSFFSFRVSEIVKNKTKKSFLSLFLLPHCALLPNVHESSCWCTLCSKSCHIHQYKTWWLIDRILKCLPCEVSRDWSSNPQCLHDLTAHTFSRYLPTSTCLADAYCPSTSFACAGHRHLQQQLLQVQRPFPNPSITTSNMLPFLLY